MFDAFVMCNPLFDLQATVTDEQLAALGVTKGSMSLVDDALQAQLVEHVYHDIVNAAPGGSGANTAIGIAQLGGTVCYTGRLGSDDHGRRYSAGMQDHGVHLPAGTGDGQTGVCLVLITPDAERTLCTNLGEARNLSAANVSEVDLRASRYLYITAYLWDTDSQKQAVLRAMHIAREAGVPIALSLADLFCVRRHGDDLQAIVNEHVDLLFGNGEELMELTGTITPESAAEATRDLCDLCAVTLGPDGSLIRDEDRTTAIPPVATTAVDATGAGDMYAAGLLYGLARGWDVERCGGLASSLASRVVSRLGPRLDDDEVGECAESVAAR